MTDLPLERHRISELRRQCRHHNVFPMFLPNAYHSSEPAPVLKALKPLVDDSIVYLSALNADELAALIQQISPGFRMMIDEERIEDEPADEYLLRVALYYLASVLLRGYLDFKSVLNPDANQSEVLKVYPELRERFDRDGLLGLDDSFVLMDGGIQYRDHILHYHQFLRRGFTSNPNFDFLGRFALYRRKSTNEFRIAIDHRRIMSIEHFQQIMELDTWYGPHFNRDHLDDLNKVGLTIIQRERPSVFDLSSKIDRTEFFWTADRKTRIKGFEVEEICSDDTSIETYFLNRYVHCERDTANATLRHFDGAVKVYTNADYPRRTKSQMPKEAKATKKIKLFRIDGNVDVDEWIELIAMFFKGNEMVLEYFDPEQYEKRFGAKIRKYKEIAARGAS